MSFLTEGFMGSIYAGERGRAGAILRRENPILEHILTLESVEEEK